MTGLERLLRRGRRTDRVLPGILGAAGVALAGYGVWYAVVRHGRDAHQPIWIGVGLLAVALVLAGLAGRSARADEARLLGRSERVVAIDERRFLDRHGKAHHYARFCFDDGAEILLELDRPLVELPELGIELAARFPRARAGR